MSAWSCGSTVLTCPKYSPVDGEVLAEGLAAAAQRVGDRAQGVREVLRLHGLQQRERVVDDLLQLDGVRAAVLPDHVAVGQPLLAPGWSGICRLTNRSPNSVLGSSRAVTSAGIWSR